MTVRHRTVINSMPDFGRRAVARANVAQEPARPAFRDDARLFALTFVGGFLFVSVYLA